MLRIMHAGGAASSPRLMHITNHHLHCRQAWVPALNRKAARRNPFLKAASVPWPVLDPRDRGQPPHWPLALSLPNSPKGPAAAEAPSRREPLSPCSTSAQNNLMAQWRAQDLPISPHLAWLQPSSGRHTFAFLGQPVMRSLASNTVSTVCSIKTQSKSFQACLALCLVTQERPWSGGGAIRVSDIACCASRALTWRTRCSSTAARHIPHGSRAALAGVPLFPLPTSLASQSLRTRRVIAFES